MMAGSAESLAASRFASALCATESSFQESEFSEELSNHLVEGDFREFRKRHNSESSSSDAGSGSFESCLEEIEELPDCSGIGSRRVVLSVLEDSSNPRRFGTLRDHQLPSFESFFDMTREFVSLFTTLHFERKCIAGVYVCVACLRAIVVLQKIVTAMRKSPQGRQQILNNCTFMKVLLNLCDLDAPVGPRICSVIGRHVSWFYQRGLNRPLIHSVEILPDTEASIKLWQLFLGKAVDKIKPLTYVAKFSKSPKSFNLPEGANSMWTKTEDDSKETGNALLKGLKTSQTPVQVGELSMLEVVGCLDARHLWVYSGGETRESIQSLGESVLEFLSTLTEPGHRQHAPTVGSIAGFMSSSKHARRVLVLQVQGDAADVWSMDYGDIYQVPWSTLVDLPPSFKCIPAQVGLCILKDVRPVPYLSLLRECVRTLRCITSHHGSEVSYHASMVHEISRLQGFKVLCDLVSCPDQECRLSAIVCMLQSCRRHLGQAALSEAGCVPAVLEHLRKLLVKHVPVNYNSDIQEKQHLVRLLQTMFLHNEQLLDKYADSDLLQVLCRIQKNSSPKCMLYRDVDCCLRTILGPAYRECRRSPQVKLVSMTAEKLRNLNRTAGQQESWNKGNPRPQPLHTELLAVNPSDGRALVPRGRFYLRGTLADFGCDGTHELRPLPNMKQASARTLAKIFCSFLNTWRPCTIYYGITRDHFVRGVSVNHEERDGLRRGVDFMVGNLRPHLTSSSYSVEFVPVLRSPEDPPESSFKSVMEVRVCGVPQTVYTTSDGECFLREGSCTYQATTHNVRGWVAGQEEGRYVSGEDPGRDRGIAEEQPAD